MSTIIKYGADALSAIKRVMILNPDGSYYHGLKAGEKDSLMEVQSEESNNYGAMEEEEVNGLYDFSYEDIRAFLDDWNSPNIGIQVLQLYVRHRILFSIFLLLDIICEAGVLFHTWVNRVETIEFLAANNSSSYTKDYMNYIFYILFYCDIGLDSFYYLVGMIALKTEKLSFLSSFSIFAIILLFGKLIFTYIHSLNILLMITKLVGYVYIKFLMALIESVLLYPPSFTE